MAKILLDNADAYIERREVPKNHQISLLPRIYVERGTKEDWDLLHELHYKAENLGIGPKIWRIVLDGQTIGVGVMTVPKMLISGRNDLFNKYLRPNAMGGMDTTLVNKYRAKWLNYNSMTNSRLVIDTMYRGAGIAYRAQNIIMRMTGVPIIEFQSSMSRFNPFASKAGIQFVTPKRSTQYEKGLLFFRRWFESLPTDFVGISEELKAMTPAEREKCIHEMRVFYYKGSSMEKSGDNRMRGTTRVDGLTPEKLIKNLQQLVFGSPLYGVYRNPDAIPCAPGEERPKSHLPDRIYIMDFDNQRTDEPLNLEKLHRDSN